GALYHSGVFVKQDYSRAKELFEKSASQGNAKAQFLLGWMYYGGQGVDKNHGHAKEWFEKSAAQGEHNSQFL
ncbi:tetratricopeptide repeat protein, partial [Klebsiella aerogenes]|uniref:tetratricopeptide repeat protein n=1 Tax=Klebsiella aerogenes TaxID=548 RepID=UPI00398450AC